MRVRFDHVALACPDLERARTHLQDRCGVTFAPGGTFHDDDSRNAVARLGLDEYVGLIGPLSDPRPGTQGAELRSFAGIVPYTAAWQTDDIDALEARLDEAGVPCLVQGREREGRDGQVVRLRRLRLVDEHGRPRPRSSPVFIQWLEGGHPSDGMPAGFQSVQLALRDPDPEPMRLALRTAGVDATVEQAERSGMRITLRAAGGEVRFDATY